MLNVCYIFFESAENSSSTKFILLSLEIYSPKTIEKVNRTVSKYAVIFLLLLHKFIIVLSCPGYIKYYVYLMAIISLCHSMQII